MRGWVYRARLQAAGCGPGCASRRESGLHHHVVRSGLWCMSAACPVGHVRVCVCVCVCSSLSLHLPARKLEHFVHLSTSPQNKFCSFAALRLLRSSLKTAFFALVCVSCGGPHRVRACVRSCVHACVFAHARDRPQGRIISSGLSEPCHFSPVTEKRPVAQLVVVCSPTRQIHTQTTAALLRLSALRTGACVYA